MTQKEIEQKLIDFAGVTGRYVQAQSQYNKQMEERIKNIVIKLDDLEQRLLTLEGVQIFSTN